MGSGCIRLTAAAVFLTAFMAVLMAVPETADAVTCNGKLVGVRPASQYNHASGRGYLAVRAGAGGGYQQLGEVYRGDIVAVYARHGKWFEVACVQGLCTNPLWGPAYPSGWVHGNYLSLAAACR